MTLMKLDGLIYDTEVQRETYTEILQDRYGFKVMPEPTNTVHYSVLCWQHLQSYETHLLGFFRNLPKMQIDDIAEYFTNQQKIYRTPLGELLFEYGLMECVYYDNIRDIDFPKNDRRVLGIYRLEWIPYNLIERPHEVDYEDREN